MMNASVRKYWHTGIGAVVALLCVGSAFAADRKVYPGLMCVDLNDSTPDIIYQSNGAARASSTTDVLCPIVRDNTMALAGVSDWNVLVNRGNSTLVWDITLQSTLQDGTAGFSTRVTVPAGSGVQNLDGGEIPTSFENGQLRILSRVPAGAEIVGYQISETD